MIMWDTMFKWLDWHIYLLVCFIIDTWENTSHLALVVVCTISGIRLCVATRMRFLSSMLTLCLPFPYLIWYRFMPSTRVNVRLWARRYVWFIRSEVLWKFYWKLNHRFTIYVLRSIVMMPIATVVWWRIKRHARLCITSKNPNPLSVSSSLVVYSSSPRQSLMTLKRSSSPAPTSTSIQRIFFNWSHANLYCCIAILAERKWMQMLFV